MYEKERLARAKKVCGNQIWNQKYDEYYNIGITQF